MFIGKVSERQLCNFFEVSKIYYYKLNRTKDGDDYISFSLVSSVDSLNSIQLYNFEASARNLSCSWRKFLYSIFQDSYIKAYSEWLDERKKEYLKELIV